MSAQQIHQDTPPAPPGESPVQDGSQSNNGREVLPARRFRIYARRLIFLLLLLFFSACQAAAPSGPGKPLTTSASVLYVTKTAATFSLTPMATLTPSVIPTEVPPTLTATAAPTATPTPTASPTPTPTATAATLEQAVQHLDTPEKLSAFLLQEITYTDHGGCLSYWPDVFYREREGNCKDYSTFASYVLAQHGYSARRVVYVFYRGGVQYGHEVAAYEIDGETWIMSNGHISGPFTSLNDYFQSLDWLDYVTLLCIKPPGGVTCCRP